MFDNVAETYGFDLEEEKVYYEIMMVIFFNIYSPFEIDRDVEFPKKDKLVGVVLRFIGGGGATYFKLQKSMPSEEEVKEVNDVCQFLKESFGDYVVARILCQPHINIGNIDISVFEDIDVSYVSLRQNDGDKILEMLCEKLKNKEPFTFSDNILRLMLPFLNRKNKGKFKSKYSKFISLLVESKKELPNQYRLTEELLKDREDISISLNSIYLNDGD